MTKDVKIYSLYEITEHDDTKFRGRYASKHRMLAAARGLGLENWFYESEVKQCEFGGTIDINGLLKEKKGK